MHQYVTLPRDSNQAWGLGQYALDFLARGDPSADVQRLTKRFFIDAWLCGASALARGTNSPTVLRKDALQYSIGAATPPSGSRWATVFGSTHRVPARLAVAANSAAVREWDGNGTNFGFCPARGNVAGEFGHNDYYGVVLAAVEAMNLSGRQALLGMILLDEIRGRLAEVFSLKHCHVDHVLHGGIASAIVYGALCGATAEQIERAVGMTICHSVPFRAIRAGKALSDSKGASAGITAAAAVEHMERCQLGFLGPLDAVRNPEAVFRLFFGPGQVFQRVGATSVNVVKADASPFDLVLSMRGDDFTITGMHTKLGLYEHQSAGAIEAVLRLIDAHPSLVASGDPRNIKRIVVVAYQPAFGIIGDPSKRRPKNRQTADHSMVYIVARVLKRALDARCGGWVPTMLGPDDYDDAALACPVTEALSDKIEFRWGGEDYDKLYPDGIPTSVEIELHDGSMLESGLVMYPGGHARNDRGSTRVDLEAVLGAKFELLGSMAYTDWRSIADRLAVIELLSAAEIRSLIATPIRNV